MYTVDDVIAKIRVGRVLYRDIVFYSARKPRSRTSETGLRQTVSKVSIVRAVRNLFPELEDIFESVIRKVLDLDHTRGIVMGATCDIDHTRERVPVVIVMK